MRKKTKYWLESNSPTVVSVKFGNQVYTRVCRTDFIEPGFALLTLAAAQDSFQFRHVMVKLKERLSELHQKNTGHSLAYVSLVRSDQQETTRPHRDGGPEESLLMLGYEPTPVGSRLFIADHTKCAHDLGITPDKLLADYNPMFAKGEQMLADYTTPVEGLSGDRFQILVLNNSNVGYPDGQPRWLGVLHQAVIEEPLAEAARIVNSTMIAPLAEGEPEPISAEDVERFMTTAELSRKVAG